LSLSYLAWRVNRADYKGDCGASILARQALPCGTQVGHPRGVTTSDVHRAAERMSNYSIGDNAPD